MLEVLQKLKNQLKVVKEKVENLYLIIKKNYKIFRIYFLKLKKIEKKEFNKYNKDKSKNIN